MRWLPDHMGARHTMDHDRMMAGTMQHSMPMSGTMQHSMPMSGTMPMGPAMNHGGMNHGAMNHGAMNHGAMNHEMGDMAAMMAHMDTMMAQMQEMHDAMTAGAAVDPAHMAEMTAHMAQMQAMMQAMHGTAAMTETMPMHGSMPGMDHVMMHGGAMHGDPAHPFDAQFIDSMIIHHQGAVDMARELIENTERPELLAFAEAIINAQSTEIADMEEWRGAWYPELTATAGMAMAMGDMTVSADASKPYEQRFLEAMISHHQGAIEMAKMALQMADHAEIKTLAEAVIAAQTTEITQMQTWLQEWFDITATPASPYVAQLASPVRGLSAQEVDDLRAGRGMGFARMAELNSHPGPAHVLELQAELALSDDQIAQVQAIFDEMSAEAKTLGEEIVTAEEALSTAFAEGAITEESLAAMIAEIAVLYGQLRNVHLRAHLQVTPLLTAEQIAQYDDLRGYTTGGGHEHHAGMNHGN
jgi:uncharacterized protein (DUF305 family)